MSHPAVSRLATSRQSCALLAIAVFVFYGEVNGITNHALHSVAPRLLWVVDLAFYCVVPVSVLLYMHKQLQVYPSAYGLKPITQSGEVLGTTLVFLVLLVAAFEVPQRLTSIILHRKGFAELGMPFFSYQAIIPAGWLHLPVATYLSISAGFLESIFFIGLPWFFWHEQFGRAGALGFIWLSSLAFASVHWELGVPAMAGALAFGLVACSLYLKIGDLWPIVGAHTLVDLIAFW